MAPLLLLTLACTSTPAATPTAPAATTAAATSTAAQPTGAQPTGAQPTGAVPTDAVPTDAVPTDAQPTDAVPTDAVPTEPTTGTGGTLRIYCCATDPRSLRPQAASGSDEISILGGIQRGLLYYNQDLSLRPELATDMPTLSDDGLTYTFTLGDHNYSNGTPIVAADYVRAVRALADPRNAFDYGYEACWIEGVDAVLGTDFGCSEGDTPYADAELGTFDGPTIEGLLDGIGVTAPDDHTVVYKLKTATSFFTNLIAMWLFTPVPETQTSWADAADIVSSGPFMIESWSHQAQMVLVPNPEYTVATPALERIEIGIGGDPAAAVAAFERGDLDIVGVPSSDVRRILADTNLQPLINRGPTLSIS
ncbi:MAG: ABC transporter substrate-binding protein, partial [Candidatus Limnocylindrales bacterium]